LFHFYHSFLYLLFFPHSFGFLLLQPFGFVVLSHVWVLFCTFVQPSRLENDVGS
jgi:hypothetical protein